MSFSLGWNEFESDSEDEDFLEMALIVAFPRRPKHYKKRHDHFIELSEKQFFERFRLSKTSASFVLEKIRAKIESPTTRNNAVTSEQKLLFTLRYYATGNMLITCSDFIGIHHSTGSRIVRLVSRSLAALRPEFVNMPETEEERNAVCQQFFSIAKFPRCIGAIDCTHIRIRSPGIRHDAESFRNRKNYFSINVQTVSDANLRIQNVVARWPGSAHDSNIFRNSRLRARFEAGEFGEYVIVGDSGYGVTNYLLTPLSAPENPAQDLYNEAQIFTRNPVERSYGVLKRRFPILSTGINVRVTTAESIIVACVVLHNIANHFGDLTPRVSDEIEGEIELTNFSAMPIASNNQRVRNIRSQEIRRNQMINYFRSLL